MSQDDDDSTEPGPDEADDAFDGLLAIYEAKTRVDAASEAPTVVSPLPDPAVTVGPDDGRRFLPGAVVAKRYRIVSLIGRGGMGEVFQADDLTLGQAVALKFLPRGFGQDPVRAEALYNEVRQGRRVSHPNVCRLHDVAEVDGRHFLTMEFIDGENLAQLLRRIGKLPRAKVIQLARQLCAGLAAAHQQGVLHLDLKPANLMIDGRGNLHITDFGLSKLAADASRDDTITGTPPYMAPEQLSHGEASVKSDIYAMGLIISEMLTGHPVQRLDSGIDEIVRQHDSKGPNELAAEVLAMDDPEISDIVVATLEKDPARRPASVAEVAARLPGGPDALEQALAAGEMPDPELVAAAGQPGILEARTGIALLLVAIFAFVGIAFLFPDSRPPGEVKPTPVLVERAKQILSDDGKIPLPDYSRYGYVWEGGQFYFWFRASPDPLYPEYGSERRVTEFDPPSNRPGMMSLRLDLEGNELPMPERDASLGPRMPNNLETWVWVMVAIASIVISARHLRLGRADRRGAFIIAVFLAGIAAVHWSFGVTSSLFHGRPDVAFRMLQSVFSVACHAAIFYLAMEPIMRQLWPETLIAWSRLLEGKWRDPLVGQSVLIGIVAGSLSVLAVNVGRWIPSLFGSSPYPGSSAAWYTQANREPLLTVAFSSGQQAVFYAFGFGVILVLFAALVRSRRVASVLAIVGLTLVQINSLGGDWIAVLVFGLSTALLVMLLVRAGVLALIFAVWTVLILQVLPLLSVSYAHAELRIGGVMLVVALFGFLISTKPQAPPRRAIRR